MAEKFLRDFFTPEQRDAILAAVRHAESFTSAEIRVRLDKRAGDDPREMARKTFDAMGMRKTELRNGVLFYLAAEDCRFVLPGDDGIHHKVPTNRSGKPAAATLGNGWYAGASAISTIGRRSSSSTATWERRASPVAEPASSRPGRSPACPPSAAA